MKLVVVFLLALFSSPLLLAADFSQLFEEYYANFFEPRFCGRNVMRFIGAVDGSGEELNSLYVVSIVNKGFSVFGMVNAEKTRGSRFNKPSEEEANWYHHVIAMDDTGMVYDFSFGIAPRILPMEEYLEEMFLIEPECDSKVSGFSGRFCAGREEKLKSYEFSSVPARDALNEDKSNVKVARMIDVLNDWSILTNPTSLRPSACLFMK